MEIVCPQCGFSRNVAESRIKGRAVIITCPKCACRFRLSSNGTTETIPTAPPHEEEDIRLIAQQAYEREANRFKEEAAPHGTAMPDDLKNPWQIAPGERGWVFAFTQTILRVMFAAPEFFKRLPAQTPWFRPFVFYLVLAVFQTLVERFWGEIFYAALSPDLSSDPQMAKMLTILAPDSNVVLAALLRTGILVLQLYVFSFVMFLAYKLVAPEKTTFSLLFQIYAYSSAPAILCIIPALGSLAALLWSLGCLATGCKNALDLDWIRTFFGFLPLLLIFAPMLTQLLGQVPK